jgi:2-polyprenyl-3-methyl-5-hydroxy-6-metoxy-1,4-benzoquinol methylase
MAEEINYIEKNKQLWNTRTEYHYSSDFYNLDGFIKGQTSLNDIELALLGDVAGKTILHLQCHFGQDTLSLARMGAITTGADLSDNAIGKAKQLSAQLNLNARFICCDIYDLPQHLHEKFDIVFTSYGTVGWLPDLDKWAHLIADYLKPGGRFIFAEFHPFLWMFDNDLSKVVYSYFKSEAIVELEQGTYANNDAPISMESVTWNHALSEVFQVLVSNGLQIDDLKEYNYSPYNCFSHMEQVGERKFIIKHLGDKIPMVYSIVATKKNS